MEAVVDAHLLTEGAVELEWLGNLATGQVAEVG